MKIRKIESYWILKGPRVILSRNVLDNWVQKSSHRFWILEALLTTACFVVWCLTIVLLILENETILNIMKVTAWITRTEKRALIPTFTMKRIKSFWRASKTSSLQFSSYLTASQRPYAARCWDPSETDERPTISHGVIIERVPIIHFIVVQRYHLMNLNVSHCRSTAGLSELGGQGVLAPQILTLQLTICQPAGGAPSHYYLPPPHPIFFDLPTPLGVNATEAILCCESLSCALNVQNVLLLLLFAFIK